MSNAPLRGLGPVLRAKLGAQLPGGSAARHYALIDNTGESTLTIPAFPDGTSADVPMSNVVADTDNYAGPNANCLTIPEGLAGLYHVAAVTLVQPVSFATKGAVHFDLFALDAMSNFKVIADAIAQGWNVVQVPPGGEDVPSLGPQRVTPSRIVFLDVGWVVHWQVGNELDVDLYVSEDFGQGANTALGLTYIGP